MGDPRFARMMELEAAPPGRLVSYMPIYLFPHQNACALSLSFYFKLICDFTVLAHTYTHTSADGWEKKKKREKRALRDTRGGFINSSPLG